jgi:hypothetical protein
VAGAAALLLALVGPAILLEIATELTTELPAGAEGCVPTGTTLPPCTEAPPSEVVVMAAAAMYIARVSPEEGGLTTPAMPDWQWEATEQ